MERMVYLKIALIFVIFMFSLFLLDYLYFLPVGVILLFFLNAVEKEERRKQHAAADLTTAKILPFIGPKLHLTLSSDEHSSLQLYQKSVIYAIDKNITQDNGGFYPRNYWKLAWKKYSL